MRNRKKEKQKKKRRHIKIGETENRRNINKKEKWLVDLKLPKKIKPLFNLDEVFNI